MLNKQVADIFNEIAKILELKGDNVFRIRAYGRAALNIESLDEDLKKIVDEDRLDKIPGVGKDLAEKIREIAKTGKLKSLDELKRTVPYGLIEMLDIPGIGPKKIKLFYDKLKIKNIGELQEKAKTKQLLKLEGIKEKTIYNILKGIEIFKKGKERMPLATAIKIANEFIEELKKIPYIKKIMPAGSLRRCKESIRDIDILVISKKPHEVMDAFTKLPQVTRIIAKGQTKSSVLTSDNTQVDLRVLEESSYGAALIYFTGSKEFNIKLRQLAIKKNFKINEYGIFSAKGKNNKRIAGKTEEELFKTLGLKYIEPELREDRGEIEAAQKNKLPKLIELKDIIGDFHVHSKWSDGKSTIQEMAETAQKLGLKYINSTDHSKSLKIARGLSIADLKKKRKEIDKLNKKNKNFNILFGTEVDIDSNGKIDYPNEVLKQFDVVVAGIHTGFKQSRERLTRRIVMACQNKYVHIIAHPSGRLWGQREAYDLDFEQILKICSETNTALEVSASPSRLDLNDINARMAKEKKVMLAIGSDSHIYEQLTSLKFGIMVARRAWLEKKDVLNTLEVNELLRRIKK
ncbi:MAG: DNA polymerase/3'-5' exonuclease PolX [Candidatus Omnitrophota bacterium]